MDLQTTCFGSYAAVQKEEVGGITPSFFFKRINCTDYQFANKTV